jgi:hypothetical protein
MLLALTVGLVIWFLWLVFIRRPNKPDFIAMFISRYEVLQIPPIPQAEADRDRIQQGTNLSSTDTKKNAEELNLGVIRDRLKSLGRKGRDDAVVFYLSAHAVVDDGGNLQLLAYDSRTFAPDTLLPLREVIDALKQCPSRKKLLVLDIMPASGGLLELGATEDAAADLISRELARPGGRDRSDDPSLAVLVPCSPGEVALWSESLGQSVFGHFFVEALRPREADADGDREISVEELANYLARQVDAWSRQHRDMPQRPMRLGGTEPFYLASVNQEPKPSAGVEEAPKDAKSEAPAEPPKAAEGKAEAKGEEKKEAEKGRGEPKSKDQKDQGKEDARPAGAGRVYPSWLTEGWELRQRWATGRAIAEAPRLFRRLEALLLRSEQDWRLKRDVETTKAKLDEEIGELKRRMEQELQEKRPPKRSAGQALAFGATADDTLVNPLKEILELARQPEPLAGDEGKKLRDQKVEALRKILKDKKSLDLALAIVKAAEDARFDVDTVRLLDEIVARSALTREDDVIELRLLRRLAQLAERAAKRVPPDWDEKLARKIWDTVVLAERANNRPRTFRWVRGMLEEADARRHEAEIRLLPRAEGYTSPDLLDKCWVDVADDYASIDYLQTTLDNARDALTLARTTLPAYLSYEEASPEQDRSDAWIEAAKAAEDLDKELERSGRDVESNPLTGDRLKDLEGKLTKGTENLQTQLKNLLKPFRAEEVRDVIAECRKGVVKPWLGRKVQALLGTPFLLPSDRKDLWEISLDLDRRLGETPPDNRGSANPGGPSDRQRAVRNLAERRRVRLVALMKLADPKATAEGLELDAESPARRRGEEESSEAEEQPPEELLARTWGALWRVARGAHEKVVGALVAGERQPGEDRAAWIVPALGLVESKNPIKSDRDQRNRAAWTWLASRYLHVSRDLQGLRDPDAKFFETAWLECPHESGGNQEPFLRPSVPEPTGGALRLAPQQASTEVKFKVVLDGSLAKKSAAMSVLETGDPRLKVSKSEELDLEPANSTPVRLQVGWDESRADASNEPPKGIIVRASLVDGKAFHLLVPIEIHPANANPRLALRVNPSAPVDVPLDPLRLRALPDKQAFFVVVRNPPSKERKVIVEVLDGDQVIATSASKDKPFLVVQSDSDGPVSFADPAGKPAEAKPTDPLPPAPQKLSLRLSDADSGKEYDRQVLRPVIASPLEYIELEAQFIPPRAGASNRLEVELRALPQMTGPPCHVKLDIPSDPELFPGFVEPPRGKLEGSIEPGKRLTLFAEDIKLKPSADDQARFSLSVDGIARALWYQTRFVREGQAQKVEPIGESWVRFRPELKVEPDKPARLTVHFKVDNAPRDALLLFRLGHSEHGKFKDDIEIWKEQVKRRHIGFDPRGKGGALMFEASVEDWTKEFEVPGLRGPGSLYAHLLDARGKELDTWGWPGGLVLDSLPPRITQLEAKAEIESTETRLPVRATVKAQSEIKEVAFIINVGSKGDFAKAEKPVPAKRSADDPDTWEATLNVPPGAVGKLVVSARAKSGAGLTAIEDLDVNIKEPPPEPQKTAAKPVEEKPGAIQGKVTENDVAQPELTVVLDDLNAKDKADADALRRTVKTAPDGTYSFSDIKPGSYRLSCTKPPMNRKDIKDVKVGSGQKVTQDLDLLFR